MSKGCDTILVPYHTVSKLIITQMELIKYLKYVLSKLLMNNEYVSISTAFNIITIYTVHTLF